MSALSKRFETDNSLERKGVDLEMAENPDGTFITFVVARAGTDNPDYKKVADRIYAPHRQAIDRGVFPDAKMKELTMQVFAEGGVIGWKNMPKAEVTGDEKDTGYEAYSKENALAVFKRLPEVYNELITFSTNRNNYLRQQVEADVGNSRKS